MGNYWDEGLYDQDLLGDDANYWAKRHAWIVANDKMHLGSPGVVHDDVLADEMIDPDHVQAKGQIDVQNGVPVSRQLSPLGNDWEDEAEDTWHEMYGGQHYAAYEADAYDFDTRVPWLVDNAGDLQFGSPGELHNQMEQRLGLGQAGVRGHVWPKLWPQPHAVSPASYEAMGEWTDKAREAYAQRMGLEAPVSPQEGAGAQTSPDTYDWKHTGSESLRTPQDEHGDGDWNRSTETYPPLMGIMRKQPVHESVQSAEHQIGVDTPPVGSIGQHPAPRGTERFHAGDSSNYAEPEWITDSDWHADAVRHEEARRPWMAEMAEGEPLVTIGEPGAPAFPMSANGDTFHGYIQEHPSGEDATFGHYHDPEGPVPKDIVPYVQHAYWQTFRNDVKNPRSRAVESFVDLARIGSETQNSSHFEPEIVGVKVSSGEGTNEIEMSTPLHTFHADPTPGMGQGIDHTNGWDVPPGTLRNPCYCDVGPTTPHEWGGSCESGLNPTLPYEDHSVENGRTAREDSHGHWLPMDLSVLSDQGNAHRPLQLVQSADSPREVLDIRKEVPVHVLPVTALPQLESNGQVGIEQGHTITGTVKHATQDTDSTRYLQADRYYEPDDTAGNNWVYLNGKVGFGTHHHRLIHDLAKQTGIDPWKAQQLANLTTVYVRPTGADIALGHMHGGYPQIWTSTIDRNHVWDTVMDAHTKRNQTVAPTMDALSPSENNRGNGNSQVARIGMADRSGVPEVDALIDQFLKTPQGDWTTDTTPIEALRDPATAHGMCQMVSEQFAEFVKQHGLKAYVTDTDMGELGYQATGEPHGEVLNENGEIVNGHYDEHTIVTIVLADPQYPYGREIYVDFTASQYGYTDHPKVFSHIVASEDNIDDNMEEWGEAQGVPKFQPGERVRFWGGTSGVVIGEAEQFEGGWWYRVKTDEGPTVQSSEDGMRRPEGSDAPGVMMTMGDLGMPPEAEQYYRTARRHLAEYERNPDATEWPEGKLVFHDDSGGPSGGKAVSQNFDKSFANREPYLYDPKNDLLHYGMAGAYHHTLQSDVSTWYYLHAGHPPPPEKFVQGALMYNPHSDTTKHAVYDQYRGQDHTPGSPYHERLQQLTGHPVTDEDCDDLNNYNFNWGEPDGSSSSSIPSITSAISDFRRIPFYMSPNGQFDTGLPGQEHHEMPERRWYKHQNPDIPEGSMQGVIRFDGGKLQDKHVWPYDPETLSEPEWLTPELKQRVIDHAVGVWNARRRQSSNFDWGAPEAADSADQMWQYRVPFYVDDHGQYLMGQPGESHQNLDPTALNMSGNLGHYQGQAMFMPEGESLQWPMAGVSEAMKSRITDDARQRWNGQATYSPRRALIKVMNRTVTGPTYAAAFQAALMYAKRVMRGQRVSPLELLKLLEFGGVNDQGQTVWYSSSEAQQFRDMLAKTVTARRFSAFEWSTPEMRMKYPEAWVYNPDNDQLYTGGFHREILHSNPDLARKWQTDDQPGSVTLGFQTPLVLGWSERHGNGPEVVSDFGRSTAPMEHKQRGLQLARDRYGWTPPYGVMSTMRAYGGEFDWSKTPANMSKEFKFFYHPQHGFTMWPVDGPDGHPFHFEQYTSTLPEGADHETSWNEAYPKLNCGYSSVWTGEEPYISPGFRQGDFEQKAQAQQARDWLTQNGHLSPQDGRTGHARHLGMPYEDNTWYHVTDASKLPQIGQQGLVGSEQGTNRVWENMPVEQNAVYMWPNVAQAHSYVKSFEERPGLTRAERLRGERDPQYDRPMPNSKWPNPTILRVQGINQNNLSPDHEEYSTWADDNVGRLVEPNQEVWQSHPEIAKWLKQDQTENLHPGYEDDSNHTQLQYRIDQLRRMPAQYREQLAREMSEGSGHPVMHYGPIHPDQIQVGKLNQMDDNNDWGRDLWRGTPEHEQWSKDNPEPHWDHEGYEPWVDAQDQAFDDWAGQQGNWVTPDETEQWQTDGYEYPMDDSQTHSFSWTPLRQHLKLGGVHMADYNGWTNWDTWHTKLLIDNEQESHNESRQIIEQGIQSGLSDQALVQQFSDWAIRSIVGPHNQQSITDAQGWNDIPHDERIDHQYEDLKDRNPQAADIVDQLGFGADVSDTDPMIMEDHRINWQEIVSSIKEEILENWRYEQGHDWRSEATPDWWPQQPSQPPNMDAGSSGLTLPDTWSKVGAAQVLLNTEASFKDGPVILDNQGTVWFGIGYHRHEELQEEILRQGGGQEVARAEVHQHNGYADLVFENGSYSGLQNENDQKIYDELAAAGISVQPYTRPEDRPDSYYANVSWFVTLNEAKEAGENYVDELAREILQECKEDEVPDGYSRDQVLELFRDYALLALTKGKETTAEDVHDAWATWMAKHDPDHKSLKPFSELTDEVKGYDEPYVRYIHKHAASPQEPRTGHQTKESEYDWGQKQDDGVEPRNEYRFAYHVPSATFDFWPGDYSTHGIRMINNGWSVPGEVASGKAPDWDNTLTGFARYWPKNNVAELRSYDSNKHNPADLQTMQSIARNKLQSIHPSGDWQFENPNLPAEDTGWDIENW